ncbi:MAG: ABC transporter ATP-binding protein, partial [candidate division Zixibacteria bacterium]|nr:ABC transporter ATP-binding protein [candidate division Zixibacteria bacterium]
MPSLSLRGVTKAYGTTTVLDNISLDLSPGELLVLLGPSGCGKTTLLRLIAGLEQADGGEIHLGERRIDRLRPRDRRVAMVFQNYALYPHMSVEKNIGFPLTVSGLSRSETKARVKETADMLGLADRLNDKPGRLSGGQRQRVALGRAIVRKPDLFLLDEPLSNLDADLRARMRLEIVRIQQQLKVTTVYVTHDQTEALTMADRIAIFHKGRIIQTGTPEDLYGDPAQLFVAEFIGQPKINVIRVSDAQQLALLIGARLADAGVATAQWPMLVGVRPEAITLDKSGEHTGKVI